VIDRKDCRPGFCRLWEAEQRIAVLQKQLREALKQIAKLSRRIRAEQFDEEA
jgi:hypothetical protein